MPEEKNQNKMDYDIQEEQIKKSEDIQNQI